MPELSAADRAAIQIHFHELIRGKATHLSSEADLKMPSLDSSLIGAENKAWFPVPGLYGGFSYWLEHRAAELVLICESWSRVVAGSGQRHEIRSQTVALVDEGFV